MYNKSKVLSESYGLTYVMLFLCRNDTKDTIKMLKLENLLNIIVQRFLKNRRACLAKLLGSQKYLGFYQTNNFLKI